MALFVLLCILVYFVVTIIRHQKRKVMLEKEKLVAEVMLLENERARIAADLHDELGSLISAIKLNLHCITVPDEKDRELIDKVNRYIDLTMDKIREIANDLMPKLLQRYGLQTAIRTYLDLSVANRENIHTELIVEPEHFRIGADKEIHLYRFILEAINNTLKHAGASALLIRLQLSQNLLTVTISDNGKGFDTGRSYFFRDKGNGLGNIARRIELMNGKMELQSAPGKGTGYFVKIPV